MGHNCGSPCAVEPVLCNKRSHHTATRDKLPLSTTREKQRKPSPASPQKKRKLGDKLGALRLRYTHCCCFAAKSLQLCPTLCNPIEGSPPGSAVPGILQARTLEWVAISFSTFLSWLIRKLEPNLEFNFSYSKKKLLHTGQNGCHQKVYK